MAGKIITRRDSLKLVGISGLAGLAPGLVTPGAAQTVEGCELAPEITAGPYYIERERIRENIAERQSGVPLKLRITVMDSRRCAPVRNAAVDVWHCDARGYYSGYTALDPDADANIVPKLGVWPPPTDKKTYLRGVQFSNARGLAEFTSIYPGWYYGRATHVHVRVHIQSMKEGDHIVGGRLCHTGQLSFPDEINDRVAATSSYTGRKLKRTLNNEDWIFDERTAAMSMLKLRQVRSDIDSGLIGEAIVVVDPDATPPQSRPRMRGPRTPAAS